MSLFHGTTLTPIQGTGLQVMRHPLIGSSDVVADDGFGNLISITIPLAMYFLSQEH